MGLLVQYSALQVLDLLTTLLFLSAGVEEGNPIVAQAIRWAEHPLEALLGVKLIALVIGIYCWSVGRYALLRRVNWLFAALVAWNFVAFYVATGQTS